MLSLLLDEHISPVVAEQITERHPTIPVQSIHHWRQGALMKTPDSLILRAAADEGLTLVTYDQKTIPTLLVEWGALSIAHGGVIFVDQRTIPPEAFGALIRALVVLWEQEHERDWRNRIFFLQKP